jgi:ATP-dependent Clp protease ATP-binding subunit ClpA
MVVSMLIARPGADGTPDPGGVGDMDIVEGAFAEAAKYDDSPVGTHHLLLALLAESSAVADALVEQGIAYDEVADVFCRDVLRLRAAGARDGLGGLNPDANQVHGRAAGIAIARGLAEPRPDEWIVAMLYSPAGMGFPLILQALGVSRSALIDALRRKGVQLPDAALASPDC